MKVLAQLTDLHTDDFLAKKYRIDARKNIETALDAIEKRGVLDLVLTGDLGDTASLPWLIEAIKVRGMASSIVLGNHDKAADFHGLDGIGDLVRKDGLYYERTIEGILCLFLDSSSTVIGRSQFAWLQERSRTAKGSNLAIFVHHPILDCGGTLMDNRYPLKNREEVATFFADLEVDVSIFCGHYHTAHVQRQGRITQHVTPALSVQFKSHAPSFQVESKKTAYRLIELEAGKLKTELVALG